MTKYLSRDNVIRIAEGAIGSKPLVRDEGLLESAVARPGAQFGGVPAYESIWEQAAALMHSLARNHALVDGNKRTAWTCARVFLELNGVRMSYQVDAAEEFVLKVATGDHDDDLGKMAEALRDLLT